MPRSTGTFGAELLAHRRARVTLSFATDRLDNDASSTAENTRIAGTALPTQSLALMRFVRK